MSFAGDCIERLPPAQPVKKGDLHFGSGPPSERIALRVRSRQNAAGLQGNQHMSTLELTDLDRVYSAPNPRAVAKAIDHLDQHAVRFISRSPFCVFASCGPDGTVDASPR